jgi:hypothetical protein
VSTDGEPSGRSVRAKIDGLYRAFVPSDRRSDDLESGAEAGPAAVEPDNFDFAGWLETGRASGPQTPPQEARVVTETAETQTQVADHETERFDFAEWLGEVEADPADAELVDSASESEEYGGFVFGEWLATGETDIEPLAPEASEATTAEEPWATAEPAAPTASGLVFDVHPVKAATIALFVAVAALAVLSMTGLLPTLGPAGGLAS